MPVLQYEPSLYPPNLLDESEESLQVGPDHFRWWALYTLSRNEKVLMRKLCAQERRFYCPLAPKRQAKARGRAATAYLPLFANYVFLQGEEQDRYAAVCTGHVARCLEITDTDSFLDQMRSIQRLIDAGLPLELEPRLEVGTRVRVKSGPLKDLQGLVVKSRSRSRFLIQVDFLQQGASTLVDGWELERL